MSAEGGDRPAGGTSGPGAEASRTAVPADTEALNAVWGTPPTLRAWIGMVNHKSIGKRFLVTGFLNFLAGGLFALLMRVQLAYPELRILDPQLYNEVFTMHGIVMAFLFIVPVLEGFAIFVLPLMVGARDLPFPRLTAFGYWVYFFASIFIFASPFVGQMPDGGWYAYVPFTTLEFSPNLGMDFWLLGITFLEISAIAAGVEIIALLVKNRAPGMSIARMPIFAWSMLVTSFIILFAFPTLILASVLLELDRKLGTVFYNPDAGGSVVLWQHLFWWFGHPDVYIWLLPGVGVISMIVPTFTRTKLVGYTWIVAASVITGILSFGVWVHHMFSVGLPLLTMSFFGAASLVFALPSGIQVFSWIATIWRGRVEWSVPMLWSVGTIVTFTFGGISGVTLGVVPFNWQAHDTYYVVAHFHYVLIGGSVMPLIAAAHYWWPLLTGRMLSERLGRWEFWLFFVGLNLTFLSLTVVGFLGMPRRVYTYLPGLGWEPWNLLATVGVFVVAASVVLFLVNVFASQRGPLAPPNPWGAGTIEWAVDSPPPQYNFAVIPTVRTRYPLWEEATLDGDAETAPWTHPLAQPRDRMREVLNTTEIDAEPQSVSRLPQQSFYPVLLAATLALCLTGVLADVYWLAGGALLASVVLGLGWGWPNRNFLPIDEQDSGGVPK